MAQTDDWQPSVEESLRRLQADTAATEAGNDAANSALMKSKPASGSGAGVASLLGGIASGLSKTDWGSPVTGAALGGAGGAVTRGIFGGGSTDNAASAAGAAPSTVLPGILSGATGISGGTGAQGIFGGGIAGTQPSESGTNLLEMAKIAAASGLLGKTAKKLF